MPDKAETQAIEEVNAMTPGSAPITSLAASPRFSEPPADDTKCAGRPGCKSNRLTQHTGQPWVCPTCQ